jgi:hypothetical protein
MEVQLHSFLTLVVSVVEWSALGSGRFMSCTHWQTRSECFGDQTNLLTLSGIKPRIVDPTA